MDNCYLASLKARKNKALLLLKKDPEKLGTDVQCNEFIKVNKTIYYLETLLFIIKSAPKTMDKEKIAAHFKIVGNYLKKEFNIDIKYSAEIKNVYSYAEYLSDIYKKIEKKFV